MQPAEEKRARHKRSKSVSSKRHISTHTPAPMQFSMWTSPLATGNTAFDFVYTERSIAIKALPVHPTEPVAPVATKTELVPPVIHNIQQNTFLQGIQMLMSSPAPKPKVKDMVSDIEYKRKLDVQQTALLRRPSLVQETQPSRQNRSLSVTSSPAHGKSNVLFGAIAKDELMSPKSPMTPRTLQRVRAADPSLPIPFFFSDQPEPSTLTVYQAQKLNEMKRSNTFSGPIPRQDEEHKPKVSSLVLNSIPDEEIVLHDQQKEYEI